MSLQATEEGRATSGRSATAPARDRLARIGRYHPLIALALYLGASSLIERQVIVHMSSVCACDATSDSTQYLWALVWFPRAILHGMNPIYTHAIWTPGGLNLAGATAVPAAALAAWPITVLAGPIVAYNVLSILAPVAGAFSAYRLCNYVTRSPWASVLAGFLYGFSTYEFATLQEHLHLVFTFCPPLVVLLVLKRLDRVISKRRFVVLMAVLLSVQLLLSTEILFTMTCMGVVALAAAATFAGRSERRAILELLPLLGASYLAMAIVCSWFLYGAARAPAFAQGWGTRFPADAVSFVVPSAITRLGGYSFLSVTTAFRGALTESGTYLGLPLMVIVASFLITRWRTRSAKVIAASLLVSVAWSLGDSLYIAGHQTITLPWAALNSLPLLDLLIPERIALYTALGCAVVAALWLSSSQTGTWRRWAVGLLAVVFIVPSANAATNHGRIPVLDAPWSGPAFFSSGIYKRYLHRDEIVLPLPWGRSGNGLLWQAQANMYFRLASGYFGPPPPSYWREQPIVYELKFNYPRPGAARALRRFLVEHQVADVIVDQSRAGPWPPILAQAGLRREVAAGGVFLYHVPGTAP
jgi:hypothetical protein